MAKNLRRPAIDINLIPVTQRPGYDDMTEEEQAEYFGFGRGPRANFDVPTYLADQHEWDKHKGNAGIVIGLDRPNNILSGFGGSKDTHCAAIDIVAGRLGYRAAHRDKKSKLVNVDPNFKLDAARDRDWETR